MSYSETLVQRYIQYKKASHEWNGQTPKLKDILTEFKNNRMLEKTDPYLFWCSDRLLSDKELEYEYCINPKLREVMHWTTVHILPIMKMDAYFTISVHIRIFASMLNKLVDSGLITKDISIYYHDNLVRNTMSLFSELSSEDLPF